MLCFQIFGFIRSELHEFINAEKDKGEEPETPPDSCSDPAIFIHSKLTTSGGLWAEIDIWWQRKRREPGLVWWYIYFIWLSAGTTQMVGWTLNALPIWRSPHSTVNCTLYTKDSDQTILFRITYNKQGSSQPEFCLPIYSCIERGWVTLGFPSTSMILWSSAASGLHHSWAWCKTWMPDSWELEHIKLVRVT